MKKLFTQPTTTQISSRLRAVRRQRGWSLADVERESQGSIKAVVMGSYERGTRSLSVKRALELAALFDIPINDLLNPQIAEEKIDISQTLMLDLRKISSTEENEITGSVNFLLQSIARDRGDWNGEILTIRNSDLKSLALMTRMSEGLLLKWMRENSLLIEKGKL